MKFGLLLFVAVLFFLLTPSILVSLPAKGNKYVVAAVHAVIFTLIFYFTYNYVARSNILEGMYYKDGCDNAGYKECGVRMVQGTSNNCKITGDTCKYY